MIPMPVVVEGEEHPRLGLGIVEYDALPADPAWSRVVIGDLCAGTVIQNGKLQVVEDTQDPAWCGLFDEFRSKSFASYPVRDNHGALVAVLNVDADKRMVLGRSVARRELYRVLATPISLQLSSLG